MIHCRVCQHELPDSSRFCGYCGAKMQALEVSTNGSTLYGVALSEEEMRSLKNDDKATAAKASEPRVASKTKTRLQSLHGIRAAQPDGHDAAPKAQASPEPRGDLGAVALASDIRPSAKADDTDKPDGTDDEIAALERQLQEAEVARQRLEKLRQEKAQKEAQKEAEEKARREAEEKAQKEAEEKARREAEEKARREAEEKARRDAEDKARREAEEKARREAEEKARRDAEDKAQKEAEAKAQKEAEAKARRDVEKKSRKPVKKKPSAEKDGESIEVHPSVLLSAVNGNDSIEIHPSVVLSDSIEIGEATTSDEIEIDDVDIDDVEDIADKKPTPSALEKAESTRPKSRAERTLDVLTNPNFDPTCTIDFDRSPMFVIGDSDKEDFNDFDDDSEASFFGGRMSQQLHADPELIRASKGGTNWVHVMLLLAIVGLIGFIVYLFIT